MIVNSRKIPDEWNYKVKKGFPIRTKRIKGHDYAYQRLASGRDPTTGKVWVRDYHLGAWKAARQKPLMDRLNAKDLERITAAYQSGEDMDSIVARIIAYTGENITAPSVYKWFQAHSITRGKRTTKRAEKRIAAAEMQIERGKAEDKIRKARQAARRVAAREEMKSPTPR